ncbi:unnamed protein product, partial [Mycena citricolor]
DFRSPAQAFSDVLTADRTRRPHRLLRQRIRSDRLGAGMQTIQPNMHPASVSHGAHTGSAGAVPRHAMFQDAELEGGSRGPCEESDFVSLHSSSHLRCPSSETSLYANARSISRSMPPPARILASFTRLFRAALTQLRNLSVLEVLLNEDIFAALATCHLPSLTRCSLIWSPSLPAFLQLNPHLKHLGTLPPVDYDAFPVHMPAVRMPRLETFYGTAALACAVVPGSRRVSELTLIWGPWDIDRPGSVLGALGASGATIEMFASVCARWETQLLRAVGAHMPGVRELRLHHVLEAADDEGGEEDMDELEAFYDSVADALPALRELRQIDISRTGRLADLDMVNRLGLELEAVRKWGRRSSALMQCVLVSETRWVRIRNNVWYPYSVIEAAPAPEEAGDPEVPVAQTKMMRFFWFLARLASDRELREEYGPVMRELNGPGFMDLMDSVLRDIPPSLSRH